MPKQLAQGQQGNKLSHDINFPDSSVLAGCRDTPGTAEVLPGLLKALLLPRHLDVPVAPLHVVGGLCLLQVHPPGALLMLELLDQALESFLRRGEFPKLRGYLFAQH